MDKETLKTTCRSMITASHYNNLDDTMFDAYIESIIGSILPKDKPPIVLTPVYRYWADPVNFILSAKRAQREGDSGGMLRWLLTKLEIIPLTLCPGIWVWLLVRLGKI